jgi:site-specific recombinase XerD
MKNYNPSKPATSENMNYFQVSELFNQLHGEFSEALSSKHCKQVATWYSSKSRDFLNFISEQGFVDPAELTIAPLLEYSQNIEMMKCSAKIKWVSTNSAGKLLTHFAERGYVPYCYKYAVNKFECTPDFVLLKLTDVRRAGSAFQPSKALEPFAEEFLANLDKQHYVKGSKLAYKRVLRKFLLFLEINKLEYSRETTMLFLEQIPKNTSWELKRNVVIWFADYISDGSLQKHSKHERRYSNIDGLPEWGRNITLNFLATREKEGFASSTLYMCRSICLRFFTFLDTKGVNCSEGITPIIVKDFHSTDPHSTPQAKNAYSAKLKQLLIYMAENNLVPPNLYLATSTQCAPKRDIISIMDDEMISAVYQCREAAESPMELRDVAIVMLGLRMGLRASDIVKLKIEDFNWTKQKTTGHAVLSFVQTKTGKTISLPIPVDAGNSVYKYIIQGRPQSGPMGGGYIFIRHRAPFENIGSIACRRALKSILQTHNLTLQPGQGFHITRRTFASRLLTSRTPLRIIADSLGHAGLERVEDYLVRDEEGMRLCPLPFATIGGGAL